MADRSGNGTSPSVGYDVDAGWDRVGSVLDGDPFAEAGSLPEGVHGPGVCGRGSVIFVDVRDSTGLAQRHEPARLARLYRAFLSELIIVLTDPRVRHIGTLGDRVCAVYDTPAEEDAAAVLDVATRVSTLRWLINHRLGEQDQSALFEYGVGVEYGPLMMINTDPGTDTAGNLAYVGPAISRAATLAHHAGRDDRLPVDLGLGFAGRLGPDRRRMIDDEFVTDPDDQGFNGNLTDRAMYEAITARTVPGDGPA